MPPKTTTALGRASTCTMLLVKLAMRCNINCTYCYWFRDQSVYDKPAVLTSEVEEAFLTRLEQHVVAHRLRSFSIVFHGGEPLLFGKSRFDALCSKLGELERRTGCRIRLSMTTNGLLVDAEWARLFVRHRVRITLSIDGPRRVHDARRLDFKGQGTFDRAVAAISILREAKVSFGVIAVCDPKVDPVAVFDFFVDELGVRCFDILMPDATHDEPPPPSVASYYKRLFDAWYAREDVEIRILEGLAGGLLGIATHTDSVGQSPITTVTMLTDGSLEPLDVLRIAGRGSTQTRVNVFEHDFHAIQADPLWREVFEATSKLATQCRGCPYARACGGGHIASRWSSARRYDNPTVYCDDIKDILAHAWARMLPDLYVEAREQKVPLARAVGGTHARR